MFLLVNDMLICKKTLNLYLFYFKLIVYSSVLFDLLSENGLV